MRYEFRWSAVSDNELKHRGLPASRYYCVIKSFCHRASLDDTEINIDTKVEFIRSFTVAITFVDDHTCIVRSLQACWLLFQWPLIQHAYHVSNQFHGFMGTACILHSIDIILHSFSAAIREICGPHTHELESATVNPLLGALKQQSSGPFYNNTVIGTLAVDWWAVTFGRVRSRGLGGSAWAGCDPAQASPRCTKRNSPPTIATASVPTSYYSMWHWPI